MREQNRDKKVRSDVI